MILSILRGIFILLTASVTVLYVLAYQENQKVGFFEATMMILLTLGIASVIVFADIFKRKKRLSSVSGVFLGLVAGLLAAYALSFVVDLIARLMAPTDESQRVAFLNLLQGVKVFIGLVTCYLAISLVLQTKDDFRFVIPYVEFAKQIRGYKVTLLDTSVIIDGRILDIAETRVLQGPLIVPKFVLHELQAVADSQDKLKRARGRRGLDVLSKLQESTSLEVSIEDTPVEGVGVDQMLVTLAQQMQARVMTNDYNLNKIANLRGVEVVNLNDLAKAMRPTVLPGEALRVKIIRPGESANQGVGYLEDGTMVVVEHARQHVGEEIAVQVTSTLQTSAGRMIFGRASETRPAIGSSGSTSISDHPRGGHANPRSNPHENTNPGAFVSPQEPKRAAASGGASGGRIVNGASHR